MGGHARRKSRNYDQMYRKVIVFFGLSAASLLSAMLPDPDFFDGSLIRNQTGGAEGSPSSEDGRGEHTAEKNGTAGGDSAGRKEGAAADQESSSSVERANENATEGVGSTRDFGNTKIGGGESRKIAESTSKETVEDVIKKRIGKINQEKNNQKNKPASKSQQTGAGNQEDNSAEDNRSGGTIPAGI